MLFCLSLASFIYMSNVESNLTAPSIEVNTIYADDLEENSDVMPDLHLIKTVMHKAFEFII